MNFAVTVLREYSSWTGHQVLRSSIIIRLQETRKILQRLIESDVPTLRQFSFQVLRLLLQERLEVTFLSGIEP